MLHEKIYSLLMKENEITWQSIIYDLVRSEEMDPWDVDVSLLTQKYIETVKELKEANFHLSGKVLLASAMLLKIKSKKLVEDDISQFDSYLFHHDDELEELSEYITSERPKIQPPPLGIKTPQARKRKISVNDLIFALEKALEVNKRRIIRRNRYMAVKIPEVPEKKVNITDLIGKIFNKIVALFKKERRVTFSTLLNQDNPDKREKILTLLPLLHLETQNKIEMEQKVPFGEIDIRLK